MKHTLCGILVLAAAVSIGCSGRNKPVPLHNSNTEWHLQLGRDYAAQGRYELAREHLLMALGTNSDPYMRGMLANELKSVDTMIVTQR